MGGRKAGKQLFLAIVEEYERLMSPCVRPLQEQEVEYIWRVVAAGAIPSPPFSMVTSYARELRLACSNVLQARTPLPPRRDARGRYLRRDHVCTVPMSRRIAEVPPRTSTWGNFGEGALFSKVTLKDAEGCVSHCTDCGKLKLWVRDVCGPLAIDCPELV